MGLLLLLMLMGTLKDTEQQYGDLSRLAKTSTAKLERSA